MQSFTLERRIAAPPTVLWPQLTEPERMNRWSLAQVRLLAPGDGGMAGAVGAAREVTITLGRLRARLVEVIVESEPPWRLVYRVVGGVPLRRHRGEVLLLPDGDGAILRWRVELAMPLPALAWLARRLVEPRLARSLDRLAALARGGALDGARSRSRRAPSDGEDALARLWAEAHATLAKQRALADELKRARDPKWSFARAYQYVTEDQLAAVRAGRFAHAGWVLRLVPVFHRYYAGNLAAWRRGDRARVERHWREAFAAMERAHASALLGPHAFFRGLALGVRAHIEGDLPRALAEVYRRCYARRCAYARFRADYALMSDIFGNAGARLRGELFGTGARVCDRVLPDELARLLTARFFYDVLAARRRAFDEGERLATQPASPGEGDELRRAG